MIYFLQLIQIKVVVWINNLILLNLISQLLKLLLQICLFVNLRFMKLVQILLFLKTLLIDVILLENHFGIFCLQIYLFFRFESFYLLHCILAQLFNLDLFLFQFLLELLLIYKVADFVIADLLSMLVLLNLKAKLIKIHQISGLIVFFIRAILKLYNLMPSSVIKLCLWVFLDDS